MATFSTTDKENILEIKSKEAFDKSVSNFISKMNSSTIETTKPKMNNTTIISRGGIPESHRRAADSFMIIKKIFGNPVVQCTLTREEKEFLAKYDFNSLEFSTAKQIEEELTLLKKWGNSRNIDHQEASDRLISIRAKELKHLIARKYLISEIYNGYKKLEEYFENISKYQTER